MNTRAKGTRIENKAKTALELMGYRVERVKNVGKFQKQVDFFGLFDLLAVNKDNWMCIQVKTNACPVQVRKDIIKFQVPEGTKKQVWIWQEKKRRWKIIPLTNKKELEAVYL